MLRVWISSQNPGHVLALSCPFFLMDSPMSTPDPTTNVTCDLEDQVHNLFLILDYASLHVKKISIQQDKSIATVTLTCDPDCDLCPS